LVKKLKKSAANGIYRTGITIPGLRCHPENLPLYNEHSNCFFARTQVQEGLPPVNSVQQKPLFAGQQGAR